MALTHFEVRSREPFGEGAGFGTTGTYEQIDGIAHFAVAPDNPANRRIIDLDLAPRDADGLVRFEADLSIVMPSSKTPETVELLWSYPIAGAGDLYRHSILPRRTLR